MNQLRAGSVPSHSLFFPMTFHLFHFFLPPPLPSRSPSSLGQCTNEESVHLFPFMLQGAESPLADVYHRVTRLMVNAGADEQNAQARTALENELTEIARSVAQNCSYSTCHRKVSVVLTCDIYQYRSIYDCSYRHS